MAKLMIILASTRPNRAGSAVANWIETEAKAHGGFEEVQLVDLAVLNLPFMDEPHHPRLGNYVHGHTREWSAAVDSADAFVFVMPEYNYGYSAPLKNAIDYLFREWAYKPVGLVSYGGVSGGLRAAQMIKQVVTTLKMTPVVDAVSIAMINRVIGEDGSLSPSEAMVSSATAMFEELKRMSEALRPLREAGQPA
ncbi:reductase [Sphaerisporangium melleum]|uniref:Reductase n=1 Tax=Sphaerisporangium melleum TaxID=321316 RepID=A0A917VFZ8_9ACTN|nr:NAD(P)H-dependent oxidoreductase [Sphaerisporangium melleum]GGK71205.1 reductase [Sphaerisporangium melleum]GII70205.1 reductase [Sphaerisporangium melleum]